MAIQVPRRGKSGLGGAVGSFPASKTVPVLTTPSSSGVCDIRPTFCGAIVIRHKAAACIAIYVGGGSALPVTAPECIAVMSIYPLRTPASCLSIWLVAPRGAAGVYAPSRFGSTWLLPVMRFSSKPFVSSINLWRPCPPLAVSHVHD
jgi:hypothetical protein